MIQNFGTLVFSLALGFFARNTHQSCGSLTVFKTPISYNRDKVERGDVTFEKLGSTILLI